MGIRSSSGKVKEISLPSLALRREMFPVPHGAAS